MNTVVHRGVCRPYFMTHRIFHLAAQTCIALKANRRGVANASIMRNILMITVVTIALNGGAAPVFAAPALSAPPGVGGAGTPNATAPSPDAAGNPRNAWAEHLRPAAKRPGGPIAQPYQPIRKLDDQGEIPEIEMFVGESRVFPTPNVARIAVGNGSVLTAAALDNRETILFANGVGTSSLFVWSEDGRYQRVKVNIVPGDTTRLAREIAAFLAAIPDTKASIIGDKVIVEGDRLGDADLAKIDELARRYPQIVNFTNRIGWEKMIMLDVKVVEFPRKELREIGLKWTPQGGATLAGIWSPFRSGQQPGLQVVTNVGAGNALPVTNADGSATGIPVPSAPNIVSAINIGISAQLNLLEKQGKVTILAEPQLSARSGSKASFLAGGEYPYTVSTINGPTVMFKPFGIKLNITPRVDSNGVVRAVIESEVSEIDLSVSTPAGPALSTRQTNTEFNVSNGDTLVLSGLISRHSGTSVDKVPLLGDIPVLGALFRSTRFQNDETELVVFVTPTVVDSGSPGLVDRVRRTTQRLQQSLGAAPYLSAPLQPGHDPGSAQAPASTGMTLAPGTERSDDTASTSAAAPIPAVQGNGTGTGTGTGTSSGPGPILVPTDAAQPPRAEDTTLPNTVASQATPIARSSLLGHGSSLRVTQDGVVLRTEASDSSEALLQLGRGAIALMTAAEPIERNGRLWRAVRVGEQTGWLDAGYVEPLRLRPARDPYSTSELARMDRRGPLIGDAAAGIDAAQSLPATANPPVSAARGPVRHYRVALDRLALRVTPDINAAAVAHLPYGMRVERLPQPGRAHWSPVQAGDKRGWVASQWLVAD